MGEHSGRPGAKAAFAAVNEIARSWSKWRLCVGKEDEQQDRRELLGGTLTDSRYYRCVKVYDSCLP